MSWLIYLFGSGLAFFAGAVLVLLAVVLLPRVNGWRASAASILAFLGLAVVGLSAAPLSYWFYVVAAAVTLTWLVRERGKKTPPKSLRWATVAIWLGGVMLELPHLFSPRLEPASNPHLYIIGDSVTAGVGSNDGPQWPRRLPPQVSVHDYSKIGATAASALKNCRDLPAAGGLVLVEIGGNDLLGSTSAAQFERDLDRLLVHVCRPDRTVLMFELPLPPLSNEYGRIQRRLAASHGVRLIPKSVLMSVLAGGGATLDSVHLSSAGHQQMAISVWQIIGPAYGTAD